MRHLTLFLTLLLTAAACRYPEPTLPSARVTGIKDGDTIEAINDSSKTTITIRLAHVDCPERSQAFGRRARQFTSDFCFGKNITLLQADIDRYGRRVCEVYVEGIPAQGRENLALVKAGLAWHFKRYSKDETYAKAENEARAARIGLWADPNPTPPWEFRKN